MVKEAIENVTLWDVRAAVKSADGISIDYLEVIAENPLSMKPFQEMADDITGWFNPSQGWHVVRVNWGWSSPKSTRTVTEEPDRFHPVFHFDAEKPPIATHWFGLFKELKFPEVFSDAIRPYVNHMTRVSTNVNPDKIASVYTLPQASHLLSAPYYLTGATVSISKRDIGNYLFLPGEKREIEPATSLEVMVLMRDLPDYTRLEVNRLRRTQRQMDKRFST